MIYPLLYLVFPRLWSVAHKHGYVTSADFVRGRFGNRWLALAVALTGIVASSSGRVVRRNAAMLPAYSLLLGLLALVGFMAVAVSVGTWLVIQNNFAPVYPFHVLGLTVPCYIALATLLLNLIVSTVLSQVLNAVASDYT